MVDVLSGEQNRIAVRRHPATPSHRRLILLFLLIVAHRTKWRQRSQVVLNKSKWLEVTNSPFRTQIKTLTCLCVYRYFTLCENSI